MLVRSRTCTKYMSSARWRLATPLAGMNIHLARAAGVAMSTNTVNNSHDRSTQLPASNRHDHLDQRPPPAWPSGSIAQHDPSAVERTALAVHTITELNAARAGEASKPPIVGMDAEWIVSSTARISGTLAQLHDECAQMHDLHGPPTGVERAVSELVGTSDAGTLDGHGGYMAYAPTGGLYVSALAGFACSAMNRGLTWLPTSPKLAALEHAAIEWMAAEVCGWQPEVRGGGIFTSGGSVANTLGLHVARVAAAATSASASAAAAAAGRAAAVDAEAVGELEAAAMYFVTPEEHYCVAKALRVLGARHVRRVPTHDDGTLDLDALGAELAGLPHGTPTVIVATAGTTSSGAIDDLCGLAGVRDAHRARGGGCWLHVDACFGGFFMLTERGKQGKLGGLESLPLADSVALDPHKALQMPYGVGALLVRDAHTALRRAFHGSGDYCPPANRMGTRTCPPLCTLCRSADRVWLAAASRVACPQPRLAGPCRPKCTAPLCDRASASRWLRLCPVCGRH
jgi:glutamate/tyrosine decarboxylase-like PLP-dependent enzyme